MNNYCVNTKAHPDGDHEVHKCDCHHLPSIENRLYLGEFSNCKEAVTEAKKILSQSNGCYACSNECHTT